MKLFEKDDWKEFLTEDNKQILKELIESTKKHRGAYSQSDNVKLAQLWTALIELKKEINSLKEHLGKLEEPWKAIISVGETEKQKTIEKLVSEIIKPTDEDTKEATKKLVESLMKF